ncbi:MAG: SDR family oxidoreductase [Phycisphaerae bacterium]
MNLKNKIAVITGATGKLGSAFALELAKAGCHCICHYNKNKSKADNLLTEIGKHSVKAIAVQADLTKLEQIEDLFENTKKIGMPQILINSAGIFEETSLEDITQPQAQKHFDINVTAALLTSKAFAENLKNINCSDIRGKIINISDIGGIRPWANYSLYCSCKAALIGLTKSLAKELAPNILVNAVAPGVATWPYEMTDEEKKRQLGFIPMGRFAEKKEVAAAMMFLLENDYITGQTLVIDGGRTI